MIVGGEDEKLGPNADSASAFARLQAYTSALWSVLPLRYRWSGKIIDWADGLPLIGGSGRLYASTGYSGRGITFGTLGAMIVCDLIGGRINPYADLFDWRRASSVPACG